MADTVTVSAADVRIVSGVLTVAARAFGSYLGEVPGFGQALEACGRLEAAVVSSGMPEDPVTGSKALAITLHEAMGEYEAAGFGRHEALEFVKMQAAIVLNIGAMRSIRG